MRRVLFEERAVPANAFPSTKEADSPDSVARSPVGHREADLARLEATVERHIARLESSVRWELASLRDSILFGTMLLVTRAVTLHIFQTTARPRGGDGERTPPVLEEPRP
jgi:hypothetical protein